MYNFSNCSSCYYNGICKRYRRCNDYYPITEAGEDRLIEREIEENRKAYYKEWNTYISE